jgi:hypothetical protein
MLDVDTVFQQRFTNRGARWRSDLRTLRTVFWMRQYFDDGHI